MSGELEKLKENREAILLAELAALLHDIGKLSTQFVDQMSQSPSGHSANFAHENAVERITGFVDNSLLVALRNLKLRDQLRWAVIPSNQQIGQLLDLILYHDRVSHSAFLVRLLNRCDGSDSGADKGTTRQDGLPKEAKQTYGKTFIANAFGYELKLDETALNNMRLELTKDVSSDLLRRSSILQKIRDRYVSGLAETRRAANDVTLWDHSFSVATLYKTSLATLLMKNALLDLSNLRWRLLRVNFDVLGLYTKAVKVSDLLGYQQVVGAAFEAVKKLVEEEYPLGNEVYRDTTGIYFSFPDIKLPDELSSLLRKAVEEVEPELAPRIAVDEPRGNTPTEQLKRMLADARKEARQELAQPITPENLSPYWHQQWENLPNGKWELCPVCRLRPREERAEVCNICEQRRGSRLEWWKQNPNQTIWLDEIADHNGRVALLVGKFGLDDWLSGDLVQTMLVEADPQKGEFVPKNPSPARLRRVWETCQRFWAETVEKEILVEHKYATHTNAAKLRRLRMLVTPDKKGGWRPNVPYDGTLDGQAISLLWDANAKHFITISNVQWTAREATDATKLASEWQGQRVVVSDPDTPRRQLSFTVQKAEPALGPMGTYVPYLSLLSSPDQFLALVPAADALPIADQISTEYQKQFGKVRNRLPLSLGLIFFPRKTALTAVIEAARRMLDGVKFCEEEWSVESFENDTLKLQNESAVMEWRVPTKMGDGTTEDDWYPYFFVAGDPGERQYRFQLKDRQLVHLKCLRHGDKVYVTPSLLDFEWLDTTGRRFEIFYDQDGYRRAPAKRNRPYLLDDLKQFEDIWSWLKEGLSTAQIKQLDGLIETKRSEWKQGTGHKKYDEVFERFVCDTLLNAGRKREKRSNAEKLYRAALTGELHDVLELHMEILKRKPEEDQQRGGGQRS